MKDRKKNRRLPWLLAAGAVTATLFIAQPLRRAAFWQDLASPGPILAAHRSLSLACTDCHVPWTGVEARNCVLCHASDVDLLQRQPTAFHASVGSCGECHPEHAGDVESPTMMDHVALAEIGLRRLAVDPDRDGQGPRISAAISEWMERGTRRSEAVREGRVAPEETVLDCSACHRNEDPHFGLFGSDCAACHGTAQWTLAAFRHPSPRSRDCAQCHQAPPSHYMEHFTMVSAKVAHQPHAGVAQCFICHQTNSWNDIRGVGWYKHH